MMKNVLALESYVAGHAGATGAAAGSSLASLVSARGAVATARIPNVPLWAEWFRHHAGSLAATTVDFAVMVALVELSRVSPALATAIGALTGAVTNFLLGRAWVFRRTRDKVGWQSLRYALVAAASLGLNTLGEYMATGAGWPYVESRILVSVLVGNAWNYPMHKFFVFGRGADNR